MKKKIVLLLTVMLAVSLLTACEEDNPLKHCVVSRRVEKSKENQKKKEQEKEDEKKAENALPDLNKFTAQTLDGGSFSEKDLAEKDLTVINIWQTTCGPCIDEMPELASLAASLPDNVALITWCLDGMDEKKAAEEILSESGFANPTIISGDGDLTELYRSLMYTPTTIAFDADGNMVGEPLIGSPDDAQKAYKDYINQALSAIGKEPVE